MASCTTPTRRTRAGSTASGACTSGSTARHSVATRPAPGSAAMTSTTASETRDTRRFVGHGVADSEDRKIRRRSGIGVRVAVKAGWCKPKQGARLTHYLGIELADANLETG